MVSPLARGVFRELQKMLPGLPDRVTHIELKTGVNCPPTVTCVFYATDAMSSDKQVKTFDIVERVGDAEEALMTRPAEMETPQ